MLSILEEQKCQNPTFACGSKNFTNILNTKDDLAFLLLPGDF